MVYMSFIVEVLMFVCLQCIPVPFLYELDVCEGEVALLAATFAVPLSIQVHACYHEFFSNLEQLYFQRQTHIFNIKNLLAGNHFCLVRRPTLLLNRLLKC